MVLQCGLDKYGTNRCFAHSVSSGKRPNYHSITRTNTTRIFSAWCLVSTVRLCERHRRLHSVPSITPRRLFIHSLTIVSALVSAMATLILSFSARYGWMFLIYSLLISRILHFTFSHLVHIVAIIEEMPIHTRNHSFIHLLTIVGAQTAHMSTFYPLI